jgi:hypothetical protein
VDTLAVVMTALLVGFLLVALSSVGFGVALFWHRPSPQAATTQGSSPFTTAEGPVSAPSSSDLAGAARSTERVEPDAALVDEPVAVLPPPPPRIATRRAVRSEPAKPIRTSLFVRLRAMALLVVVVLVIAALIGAVLSALAIVVGLLLA